MNAYVSLLVIFAFVTLCSAEKHVDSTKSEKVKQLENVGKTKTESVKGAELVDKTKVDSIKEKERVDNTKVDNVKDTEYVDMAKEESNPDYYSPDYYNGRRVFKDKVIPQDYFDYLYELYDIKEDPLAAIEGREPIDSKNEGERIKTEKASLSDKDLKTNSTEQISSENVTEDSVIDKNATDSVSNDTCKVCELREEDKLMRIEGIKRTILSKLGFSSSNLPNVTKKHIPRTPSFEKLVEKYEMLGDAPYGAMEDEYLPEDEYYGNIQRAYTIGQEREYNSMKVEIPNGSVVFHNVKL